MGKLERYTSIITDSKPLVKGLEAHPIAQPVTSFMIQYGIQTSSSPPGACSIFRKLSLDVEGKRHLLEEKE